MAGFSQAAWCARLDRLVAVVKHSLPSARFWDDEAGTLENVGSITALVTPWTAQGTLDVSALRALIDWQVQSGIDGLVIAGSTGESVSLEPDELDQLWQVALEAAAGRIRMIAGTGTPSTARSAALTRRARDLGFDAALVVTPAYVRPTQHGLYAHYVQIADAGLPILLYNVPGRTAVDLLPATIERLREVAGIIGIKEAVSDPARIQALAALRTPQFRVWSGDDPSALQALRAGFDGVISVASNVVPAAFAALVRAARAGTLVDAERIDAQLQPLYAALGLEPNPIPVKYALARLGRCLDGLRLPLSPLSAVYHAAVDTALAQAASAHI